MAVAANQLVERVVVPVVIAMGRVLVSIAVGQPAGGLHRRPGGVPGHTSWYFEQVEPATKVSGRCPP